MRDGVRIRILPSDQRRLTAIAGIHERIARDAGLGSRVRCETCKRVEVVNPGDCLRSGWPTCCYGYTMTLLPKETT